MLALCQAGNLVLGARVVGGVLLSERAGVGPATLLCTII